MNRDLSRERLRFPTKWSCGTRFPRFRGSRTTAQSYDTKTVIQPDQTAANDTERKAQEPNE